MSLASGLREAQIREIPAFSHCSQLSQDPGGCCIHSGFLGVGQRGEPSVSTQGLVGLGSGWHSLRPLGCSLRVYSDVTSLP